MNLYWNSKIFDRLSISIPEFTIESRGPFRYQKMKGKLSDIARELSLGHQSVINSEVQKELKTITLGKLESLILKVCNVVIKIFNSKFSEIDELFVCSDLALRIQRNYQQILDPSTISIEKGGLPSDRVFYEAFFFLRQKKLEILRDRLDLFQREGKEKEKRAEAFDVLPVFLKNSLLHLLELQFQTNDLDLLFTSSEGKPSQMELFRKFLEEEIDGPSKKSRENLTHANHVLNLLGSEGKIEEDLVVYGTSFQRALKEIRKELLDQPIRVAMVAAEYASLAKAGGLAEVVEGLSRALLEENDQNQVRLVFPKFSHLPKEIVDQLGAPKVYLTKKNEPFKVYELTLHGVLCQLIEDPSFELEGDKPSIYDNATRFAVFSELAADLLYHQKQEVDVIHLHDWHVAGVALKLKQDHPDQWQDRTIPPVLFTYHNNQRGAQGRLFEGVYSYDSVVAEYRKRGIVNNSDNLFVRALETADAVTTVSPTFALESQKTEQGEGVGFAVRKTAKLGKLIGVLNGNNLKRFDPSTDSVLKSWRDLATNQTVDLTYGLSSPNIAGQKEKAKEQLGLWLKAHFPAVAFNPSKPLVTYIGRFDSRQKGMDQFEAAIESALSAGGQCLFIGSFEDPDAETILDHLEDKYSGRVCFIRDHQTSKGKLYYQQELSIGPLIRAASDFMLIPSTFEPCGLVQFEGWRFGSFSIGASTGGLLDTIVANRDSPNFNGFLFERDGHLSRRVGAVVGDAIRFFYSLSPEKKEEALRKLMQQGDNSGWDKSRTGDLPSVTQYRIAYQNAIDRASFRKNQRDGYSAMTSLFHRQFNHSVSSVTREEQYLFDFYQGTESSLNLEKMYESFPPSVRANLPSPYGRNVNILQHHKYGAFLDTNKTRFSLSAPAAKQIFLVLDTPQGVVKHPMKKDLSGDWALELPQSLPNQKYRYEIDGVVKLDPYARSQSFEGGEIFCQIVDSKYDFTDQDWLLEQEKSVGTKRPMNIYEIHPGIWKKKPDGSCLNYRELAPLLVEYANTMHFTHIELMGILEHPAESSWGYQVTGYYAPNSRFGSVDDFKYMIDTLHKNQVGVILDWVPGHFASDSFGLSNFDGTPQFEASGLKYLSGARNLFFRYGSSHFNYERQAVRDFLISSAMFWLREMHIDGLRVDCVRGMLASEDRPSSELFLKDLNAAIHKNIPRAFTVAEDFSGDTKVSLTPHQGGFDFDMKWHVGWFSIFFDAFSSIRDKKICDYAEIKRALMCDNFHAQIMPLSHDFSNKINSMISRNGKTEKERDAMRRSFLSFMMTAPGKKLTFMGLESGHKKNWTESFSAQAKGVCDEGDEKLRAMMARLGELYVSEKGLHEKDDHGGDIYWIEDPNKNIHAYRRTRDKNKGESLVCLHNFSCEPKEITIAAKGAVDLEEVFNSDDTSFGGEGRVNSSILKDETRMEFKVQIPPLSTVVLKEKNLQDTSVGYRIKSSSNSEVKASLLSRIRSAVKRMFEWIRWVFSGFTRYIGFRPRFWRGLNKKLSVQQAKENLVFVSAAAAVHSSNPEWVAPFGYRWFVPERYKIDNLDLEKRDNCYFNPKSGLKVAFMEKGDSLIVAFGALGSATSETSHPDEGKKMKKKALLQVIQQWVGGIPSIYKEVDFLIRNLKESFPDKKIVLVGQCAGGGLAQYGAMKHSLPAVCVNSLQMGVGLQQDLGSEGLSRADQYVRHLVIENDFLSNRKTGHLFNQFLSKIPIRTPGNFGKRYEIRSAYKTRKDTHERVFGSYMAYLGKDEGTKPKDLPPEFFST